MRISWSSEVLARNLEPVEAVPGRQTSLRAALPLALIEWSATDVLPRAGEGTQTVRRRYESDRSSITPRRRVDPSTLEAAIRRQGGSPHLLAMSLTAVSGNIDSM